MKDLHVFELDACEWVIAESAHDAEIVMCETYGETTAMRGAREEDWEQLPDEQELEFWCDAAGKPSEIEGLESVLLSRPAAAWVRMMGRGYLGTTEQ